MHRRTPLEITREYHERTKHHPFRYAASLGYMDWATQPDPFRRYRGAPVLPLDLTDPDELPSYAAAFAPQELAPAPLDRLSISRLFRDALAISAWKRSGSSQWALRVNPSSGNLHPTEGYLVAGPVPELHPRPAVFHYTPSEHALELRTDLTEAGWDSLAAQLPPGAVLVGLASIYWRESWKYGERAFRYCHHDVGHAIGSLTMSAAALGWASRLLESVPDGELELLLGVSDQTGVEAEHGDVLIVLFPAGEPFGPVAGRNVSLPECLLDELRRTRWLGEPNRLSRDQHRWPAIDEVSVATGRHAPAPDLFWAPELWPARAAGSLPSAGPSLRRIVQGRRSAVALDGRTGLDRAAFFEILDRTLPAAVPFTTLPWHPCVDLLLFVHRVSGVEPGLYALLRDPGRRRDLETAMQRRHAWIRPDGCPDTLPLFLLERGDARTAARQTSCEQEIAADGAFAAAMLADYKRSVETFGAPHYRRLFWEAGLVGQVLYLEAEAHGLRGTGIGCFFDDLTHQVFGLEDDRFQVLYHFTMGSPLDDPRLQTLPPYHHLAAGRAGRSA